MQYFFISSSNDDSIGSGTILRFRADELKGVEASKDGDLAVITKLGERYSAKDMMVIDTHLDAVEEINWRSSDGWHDLLK